MWKKIPSHRLDGLPTHERVWNVVDPLFSIRTVERFINNGVKTNFWGFDISKINSARQTYKDLHFAHSFNGSVNISPMAEHVIYYVSQAKDYFSSAQTATVVTKPTLIYYGLVSFGKALIVSMYGDQHFGLPPFKGHGLDVFENPNKGTMVRILRRGEFQLLHDAVCEDTSIYSSPSLQEFALKDLFALFPHIRPEFELGVHGAISVDPEKNRAKSSRVSYLGQAAKIVSASGDEFRVHHETANLHLIDAHFLTLFTLSFLARYRAPTWKNMLDSELGITVRAYLDYCTTAVPMCFYSELSGMNTYFLPYAYLG